MLKNEWSLIIKEEASNLFIHPLTHLLFINYVFSVHRETGRSSDEHGKGDPGSPDTLSPTDTSWFLLVVVTFELFSSPLISQPSLHKITQKFPKTISRMKNNMQRARDL